MTDRCPLPVKDKSTKSSEITVIATNFMFSNDRFMVIDLDQAVILDSGKNTVKYLKKIQMNLTGTGLLAQLLPGCSIFNVEL